MAPFNPNTAKRMATNTPSSTKRGVAKMVSKKSARGGTRSIGTIAEAGLQDRLRSLPNDMLLCILTMLSVHDAARTAVLSKSWEHLFSECQSDTIDDKYVYLPHRSETSCSLPLSERCSIGIYGALASTLIKGRHSIRRFILEQTLPSQDAISKWLNTLSLVGVVEEIVLKMPCPKLFLPHFIFNCISLRSLSLSNFRWPHIDPNRVPIGYIPSWTLPLLVELTLRVMDMTPQDVMVLLQRCPALLSLSLCCPRRGGSLVIQCKNLLSLTIEGGKETANYSSVVIKDVPKLERLLGKPQILSLGCAIRDAIPRLHTVGIFHMHALKVVFGQLRTVALITNLDDSDEVQKAITSLHNLPQLETLHMQVSYMIIPPPCLLFFVCRFYWV
jgi:hypothetical protein